MLEDIFPNLNIRKLLKLWQEVEFLRLFSHFSNSTFADHILKTFIIFIDMSTASELQRMLYKSIQNIIAFNQIVNLKVVTVKSLCFKVITWKTWHINRKNNSISPEVKTQYICKLQAILPKSRLIRIPQEKNAGTCRTGFNRSFP